MAVSQCLSWVFCCVLVLECVYGSETTETAHLSTAATTAPEITTQTRVSSQITIDATEMTVILSPNTNTVHPTNTTFNNFLSTVEAVTTAFQSTTPDMNTTIETPSIFSNSGPPQPSKTNVAQTTSSSTGTISNNPLTPTQTTEPGRSPVSALKSLVHVYPTIAYNADNTCPFGYKADVSLKACVHLCEYKKCQNGGECYAEVDVKNGTIAKCRCQETSRYVYKGDNCETSAISRSRERALTLGILLPFSIIFLFIIVAMCMKLKRGGNEIRAAHKSYDINNL